MPFASVFNFFLCSTRVDIKTNPFRFINMSFKDAYRDFESPKLLIVEMLEGGSDGVRPIVRWKINLRP